MLLRRALHACQKLVPDSGGGITILGYHLIGAGTGSPIDLPSTTFRRQMAELAQSAEVEHLDPALESLHDRAAQNRRLVVLTFDDGYENFYDQAWPVLQEYGLPATLYVHVDFVSNPREGPIRQAGSLPPLTWNQLRELAASELVSIGSHSCSHSDLRKLEGPSLERELEDSKSMLESRLGLEVDSFCYPRGQWSPRVEPRVAAHYRTAVIRGGRTMRPGRFSQYRLERVPVRVDMPVTLRPVLDSSVWLEEWWASKIRQVFF